GPDVLSPAVEVLSSDYLDTVSRERVRRRLADWLGQRIAGLVRPLFKARKASLNGPARGLAFQITEALGSVPAATVANLVSALSPEDRKALTRLGIRFGTESVFMPEMLKPARIAARVLLWCVHTGESPVQPPRAGAVSSAIEGPLTAPLLEAAGYRTVGNRALRADILERVAAGARQLSRHGRFAADSSLMALAGCSATELGEILVALGYRQTIEEDGSTFFSRRRPRRGGNRRQQEKRKARESASPFSELGQLRIGGS
ncbi:MAG: disulfide oxidoreductase, partial [Rhodospirillaceae bacterium]|nr:disulfide oxidoreductase [Rhodospirillaceae bacterium]